MGLLCPVLHTYDFSVCFVHCQRLVYFHLFLLFLVFSYTILLSLLAAHLSFTLTSASRTVPILRPEMQFPQLLPGSPPQ